MPPGRHDAPLVALTGGTGFLGRYVAAHLLRAGWRVRMLVRVFRPHPLLDGCPLELVLGSLEDRDALDRLVTGASAVVHAAGLVKARRRDEFFRVNRDGSARLAASMDRVAPGARLVLVSSQAAREPGLSFYAASKRAGEDAVCTVLGPDKLCVLRPPVIYGPWDGEGTALLRLAGRRVAPVPWAPEPVLAMIHAADAAEAVRACCAPGAPVGLFELSDGNAAGYPWRTLVTETARALGHPPPRFLPVPDAVLRSVAAANAGWTLLRRRPALFGPGKAREILHRHWAPDPSRMLPPATWRPAIGLRDGLTDTVAWWTASNRPGA